MFSELRKVITFEEDIDRVGDHANQAMDMKRPRDSMELCSK